MKYDIKDIINYAFRFTYAGIVMIHIQCNKKTFSVVGSGFQIIEDIPFFNPYCNYRKNFETLNQAIEDFNNLVNKFVNNHDWYKPLIDDECVFKKENFIKLYNKRIYDNVY